MALCNVTGTVYLPNGDVASRREVVFYKLPDNVTADYLGAVVPEPVVVRTDSAGDLDVNLITGNYYGHVQSRNGKEKYPFRAIVPEAATADFADLITAVDPVEPLPAWLQQALQARDDARDSEVAAGVSAGEAADSADLAAALTAESPQSWAQFADFLDYADGKIVWFNGVQFVRDASANIPGIGSGAGWRPVGDASPAHFDGNVQAAVDSGLDIDGRGVTYQVDQSVSLAKRRHKWKNITLDGTGIATSGDFTTPVAFLAGDLPVLVATATTDIPQSASSGTFSVSSTLSEGDWVLLRSQKIMAETEVEGQVTRHSRACELMQVKAVSGSVVEFWTSTQDSYAVSDNARLERVQTVAGVDFENVRFIGADVGFDIKEGFKNRYRNVSAVNQTAMGIDEDRCYLTDGDDFWFESQATQPVFTQAPYGLVYTGCQNCSYGDISGIRTRHLTTTGSSGTSSGRTVSRNCSLGDINAEECFSSPVDQHPGGGYIQVGNVFATFTPNATQKVAVQLQGGGAAIKSIHSPAGEAILFDCFGFFSQGYTPSAFIGAVSSYGGATSVNLINYSNRYGTGMIQAIILSVGSADIDAGVAIRATPLNGNINVSVNSGRLKGNSSLGLGRAIYALAGTYQVRITSGSVVYAANPGSRVIQLDAGSIDMFGGSVGGVGGSAEVRLTGAKMQMFGVREGDVTYSIITGGQVLRATMA